MTLVTLSVIFRVGALELDLDGGIVSICSGDDFVYWAGALELDLGGVIVSICSGDDSVFLVYWTGASGFNFGEDSVILVYWAGA